MKERKPKKLNSDKIIAQTQWLPLTIQNLNLNWKVSCHTMSVQKCESMLQSNLVFFGKSKIFTFSDFFDITNPN